MDANQKQKRSIRNYLINPEQQLRFASLSFFTFFLGLGLQTFFVLNIVNVLDLSGGNITEAILASQIVKASFLSLFLVTILGGIIIFILNVLYTHRIYGSLHVIRQQIRKVLGGEKVEPLRGRKNDQVNDLTDLVNKLVQVVQDQREK